MKRTLLFSLLILFFLNGFCHSGKAKFHVIIDTDAALDDMRAISMMLATNEIEVLAITTSDGLMAADAGLMKVRALLKTYGHEGVYSAKGINCNRKSIACRSFLKDVFWGDENDINTESTNSATELILNSIKNEDEKVSLVCLGPLTNIANVFKTDKKTFLKIDKIFWYCDSENNLNYELDKTAADIVINSGITIYKISSEDGKELFVNDEIINNYSKIHSKYSKHLFKAHNTIAVRNKIDGACMKLWDDLLPVFMLYPELFSVNKEKDNSSVYLVKCLVCSMIKEKIYQLLSDRNSESIVFIQFPVDSNLFANDVKNCMNKVIQSHGYSEWRAGVLTNELHGHLGIYSIVGTKMGMRAREYFNIGVDDIKILSFAGKQPPFSCLNDGLQVSTGATIGHGLIEISEDKNHTSAAIFTFKNISIKISLKQNYQDIIKNDIKEAIKKNGNLTPEYWKYVRILALQYWANWSRNEIFELEILNKKL